MFDFIRPELGRLAKKNDEKIRRMKRKRLDRRLLSWMDTEVRDIPSDVIVQLDELIAQRIKEVQAKWTPEDEAERRGLDIRKLNRLSKHDGRYFEPCTSTSSLFEDPAD